MFKISILNQTMKQFDLDDIKRLIAQKYNWGPTSGWTNFHFRELSKEIERVTGDRLSEETLKRIFGKRRVDSVNYQPQAFSQIVLQKFVDSFTLNSQKYITENSNLKKTGSILVVIIVFVILLIVSFNFLKKSFTYSFECINPLDHAPYTAKFYYNISEIDDSVFTDFGINLETYLPPEKSMINHFYKNGGIYQIHFYTRSEILDTLKIMVCSPDWQGGYFPNNEPDGYVPFLNQSFYRSDSLYYASPDDLKKEGVDLNEQYYTTYKYFSCFNKNLDSLTLETRVYNNESTGSFLCYDIEISLIGDSGNIVFRFIQPKCSRYARIYVSEKQLNGEFDDLSSLAVDMSDWLDIRMTTNNGKFELYLSDNLIFKEDYERPLGNLLGIEYSFFGSGKIDYLELKDGVGKTFYKNGFSK